LARALDAHPKIDVLAPWDLPRGDKTLRPRPGAVVLVPSGETNRADFHWVMPYLRRQVDQHVHAPSRAHITGIMAFGNGVEEASLDAASTAEKIALPLLVLILLLVFRSPVAAAIPLLLGGLALVSGRGLVRLVAELHPIDAAAVTTVSMMALALGVDYGLLIVSRYREEVAAGKDHAEAAAIARRTAGRTVVFASVTLWVAMLIAVALSPGDLLRSMATGTLAAVTASATLAVVGVPAALTLLGRNVDRWRFSGAGAPGSGRRRFRGPAL